MGTREYGNAAIVVHWDAARCIHTGICTRGLPGVFDVTRRPWIDVDAADADAIATIVQRCPTGALRYDRPDGKPGESADPVPTVVPIPGGPLYVRGAVRIARADGTVLAEESRVALCRCGATGNAPFCDNSHRTVGFGADEPGRRLADSAAESPEEICEPQAF